MSEIKIAVSPAELHSGRNFLPRPGILVRYTRPRVFDRIIRPAKNPHGHFGPQEARINNSCSMDLSRLFGPPEPNISEIFGPMLEGQRSPRVSCPPGLVVLGSGVPRTSGTRDRCPLEDFYRCILYLLG